MQFLIFKHALERNQTAAERAAENKSEKNIRGMKMDGKNREEQENGAKVRDLEEYKAENRKRKRRRRITVGILAGAILEMCIRDSRGGLMQICNPAE